MIDKIIIDAVFAVLAFSTIEAVLHEITSGAHVSIFAVSQQCIIVRVLVIKVKHTRLRGNAHQIFHLLEKRSSEIKISSVLRRIPLVRPPTFRTKNRKRRIGIKSRNDLFLAHIALPPEKVSLVSERQPSLHSASGAMSRFGNVNFNVKRFVFGGDLELLRAVFAGFRIHIH
ncbi:hypothetical protein A2344_03455 [Candidatus Peregrinibacteria bacterium RIFOXYB12_FULL_41_12]|nr:MAG: hypothetical protein A2344_03455 [Candidatus Peregrinibacteria bacterium RIFOXYB12_FULL_41_12]